MDNNASIEFLREKFIDSLMKFNAMIIDFGLDRARVVHTFPYSDSS